MHDPKPSLTLILVRQQGKPLCAHYCTAMAVIIPESSPALLLAADCWLHRSPRHETYPHIFSGKSKFNNTAHFLAVRYNY
jgi:hypothetical protein